jgi:integrase
VADYRNSLQKLQLFFSTDPPLAAIDRNQLIQFFVWLRDEYVSRPGGVAPRGDIRLCAKSRLNIHVNLSALWQWAVNEGLLEKNLIRAIEAPDVSEPVIVPYLKEEVEAMLNACDFSRNWKNREDTANHRHSANRDRAIILTLLDTGARASELVSIQFKDVNFKDNSRQGRGCTAAPPSSI